MNIAIVSGANGPVACRTEALTCSEALGLAEIPPELREDHRGRDREAARGWQAAQIDRAAGRFDGDIPLSPQRLERRRGHAFAEMAEAARSRGMQYLGIADHSRSAGYAGGLSYRAACVHNGPRSDALNQTFGGRFHVFKGTECDILGDGSLDYPDEFARRLRLRRWQASTTQFSQSARRDDLPAGAERHRTRESPCWGIQPAGCYWPVTDMPSTA